MNERPFCFISLLAISFLHSIHSTARQQSRTLTSNLLPFSLETSAFQSLLFISPFSHLSVGVDKQITFASKLDE